MLFGLFGGNDEKKENIGIADCSEVVTGLHSRCLAAKGLIQKFGKVSKDNPADIIKEEFDRFKEVAENLCGIKTLVYDPEKKYIDFTKSEINADVKYPKLTTGKLVNLTKEELVELMPEIKEVKPAETVETVDEKVVEEVKKLGEKHGMEAVNVAIAALKNAEKSVAAETKFKTIEDVEKWISENPIELIDIAHKMAHDKRLISVFEKHGIKFDSMAKVFSNPDAIDEIFKGVSIEKRVDMFKNVIEDNEFSSILKDYIPEDAVHVIVKQLREENTNAAKYFAAFKENTKTPKDGENPTAESTSIEVKKEKEVKVTTEENHEVKQATEVSEEATIVVPGLKTQENIDAKKHEETLETPAAKTPNDAEVNKTPETPKAAEVNETPVKKIVSETAVVKDKPIMVTFADKVKEGLSKFELEMFNKVVKKLESAAGSGLLKNDVKISNILIKRCDKENKLVTFLFKNDSTNMPLVECFYSTGNHRCVTNTYKSIVEFVNAHKERFEAAKKDAKLKAKCYNINYKHLPGYVAEK